MTIEDIKALLHLHPHPKEGGFFAETYRSADTIPVVAGSRHLATAIFYLLTPHSFSEMHRLPGDEIFHFYLGDPVEMLQLYPDGTSRIVVLGHDIAHDHKLQHVVGGGVWQGARLIRGGSYALLGTTMSPGFAYEDYESGTGLELASQYPLHAELIRQLSRSD